MSAYVNALGPAGRREGHGQLSPFPGAATTCSFQRQSQGKPVVDQLTTYLKGSLFTFQVSQFVYMVALSMTHGGFAENLVLSQMQPYDSFLSEK